MEKGKTDKMNCFLGCLLCASITYVTENIWEVGISAFHHFSRERQNLHGPTSFDLIRMDGRMDGWVGGETDRQYISIYQPSQLSRDVDYQDIISKYKRTLCWC